MSTRPSDTSMAYAGLICPECGYNLQGLPEARCPECGCQFDPDELTAREQEGPRWPAKGLVVLALAVYAGVMGYAFVRIAMNLAEGHMGYIGTKLRACYVWPPVFPLTLVAGGVLLAIGWPAIRQAKTQLGKKRFGEAAILFVVLGGWLPSCFMVPMVYVHAIYEWLFVHWVRTAGGNILMSTVPTTIIVLRTCPWRLMPEVSLMRVLCAAWAVLLLCYGFAAALSLPIYGPFVVE